MSISQELHARVNAKIKECFVAILGQARADRFVIPVTYRTDMKRVAGLAYMQELRIEFSEQLLLANTEKFFISTIPHEAAHLITEILYPNAKQCHGPEWKSIMIRLGVDAKRGHTYDISVTTAKISERFEYKCNCRSLMISKILHNKMERGDHRRCTRCVTRITYNPQGENND